MNPNREELIFGLALTKPANDRAVFFDRECEGDPVLRQRLEALLAARDAPDERIRPVGHAQSRSRISYLVVLTPKSACALSCAFDEMMKATHLYLLGPARICATVVLFLFSVPLSAQTPDKVDFEQDVQPLLRQNCVSCHGPKKQKAGMRLDRRSSLLKKFSRRVVPGSSENSMVYHRLVGEDFGPQMPPTGPLRPEQIAVIKAWID